MCLYRFSLHRIEILLKKNLLTFVLRATDVASEVSFAASVGLKQVAAVRAKHE
jgi:hypothetical protein